MTENPFEWLLRATREDDDTHQTLTRIGRKWQEEEREFECNAEKPFTRTGLDGNPNEPLIPPCADHTRYVKIDGKCACVTEPYRQNMEDIEELIAFCKERNMTFTIDGESSHFPGGCLRIVVREGGLE